jgi:hypothetical protein
VPACNLLGSQADHSASTSTAPASAGCAALRASAPSCTSGHTCGLYNPDGTGRAGELDFITYFECADEHLGTFEQVCGALRDERQNPEWRYVVEGPEWRGKRVLKW